MRAAIFRNGEIVVDTLPEPKPAAGQVLVKTLGVLIYRLDSNLRHSTVIGIVGAGGIGQTLSASFSRYDFDFASAILLTIAAMVAFGEWFSDWARRRLR